MNKLARILQLFFVVGVLIYFPGYAQTTNKIVAAEYFWGITDPGAGNGTAILSVDGNLDQSLELLYASGLIAPLPGQNLLNIRVKDGNGKWGPLFKSVIRVDGIDSFPEIQKRFLTAAEYFWGLSDPGTGNGTPILAIDGNLDQSLEQLYASGLSAPMQGQNLFNIRVKDNNGKWGPLFKSVVRVSGVDPLPYFNRLFLIAAEYFWGATDPGTGNGTPILAVDGNFNQSLEQLYASGLFAPNQGQNLFNIRVKDSNGKWGPLFKSVVRVDGIDPILAFPKRFLIAAEYFWGLPDPGAGNGTPILAVDGNLDQSLEQLYASGLTAPLQGQNIFNIRVKDNNNKWGPVFKSVVRVDGIDPLPIFNKHFLTAAEYFWGLTDPGTGNGTPVLAIDGNLDESLEQLYASGLTAPVQGQNLFNIRVKDNHDNWGPLFKSTIRVDGIDPIADIQKRFLTMAEYFWDVDPGIGNGTPFFAEDGNYDQPYEKVSFPAHAIPANGIHALKTRTKDNKNKWGPVFTSVINISAPGNEYNVYTTPEFTNRCNGDSAQITAYGAQTYEWSPAVGLNFTSGNTIKAAPDTSTTYRVVGTNINGQKDTFYVKVHINQFPVINSFETLIGSEGTMALIHGKGFSTANSVTFNGANAAFKILNDTLLSAPLPLEASSGLIKIENACGLCFSADTFKIVTLNLKVFLQALYIGNENMKVALHSNQFNSSSLVCDSIVVQLHDILHPDSIIGSFKSVLNIDGHARFIFPFFIMNHTYYLAIRHRNSLETWSKYPVLFDSSNKSFDLTRP